MKKPLQALFKAYNLAHTLSYYLLRLFAKFESLQSVPVRLHLGLEGAQREDHVRLHTHAV
jgi:hypothetical protein